MTSSNNNWVCFDCRYSKREPKTIRTIPLCIYCKKELYNLGYKIPVPKKKSLKEWKELQICVHERDVENLVERQKNRVEIRHQKEKALKALESKVPNNKAHEKQINLEIKSLKGCLGID